MMRSVFSGFYERQVGDFKGVASGLLGNGKLCGRRRQVSLKVVFYLALRAVETVELEHANADCSWGLKFQLLLTLA